MSGIELENPNLLSMSGIELDNPNVLQQLGWEPLPDLNNMTHEDLKRYYYRLLVMANVIESRRGKVFARLFNNNPHEQIIEDTKGS